MNALPATLRIVGTGTHHGREALLLADLAHATPLTHGGPLAHTSLSPAQQASTLSGHLGTAIGILDDGGGQIAPLRMLSRFGDEFRATGASVSLPHGHSLLDPFPGFRLRPSADSGLTSIVQYAATQRLPIARP
ncbi:MAG: hypothetical protein JWM98_3007 [Thermoleophilia bacterium]|nr:hypothetical protein [Thermoleophilia bacterium]